MFLTVGLEGFIGVNQQNLEQVSWVIFNLFRNLYKLQKNEQ